MRTPTLPLGPSPTMPSMAERTQAPLRRWSKWSRLLRLLAEYPIHISTLVAISLLTGLSEVGLMLVVSRLALNATSSGDRFDLTRGWSVTVDQAILIGAAILVARFLFTMLSVRIRSGLNYRVVSRQRSELAQAFLEADRVKQLNEPSGALQKIVAEFPTRGSALLGQTTLSIASALSLLTAVVSALLIDPGALGFMIGGLVVISFVLGPLKNTVGRRSAQSVDEQLSFANELGEIDEVSLEIKAFGVESAVFERIRSLIGRDAASQMRLSLVSGLMTPIYSLLAYALVLLAVASVAKFEFLRLDSFTAVVLIMIRGFTYGQEVQNGVAALHEYLPYLDTMEQFRQRLATRSPRTNRPLDFDIESLRFEEVSFSYPNRPQILSNFSLSIRRGESIGVVGSSGAGKTTLVQVMTGLLEPQTGRFYVNEGEVEHADFRAFAKAISFVPQTAHLFSGSIRENLVFFRTNVSDSDVIAAVDKAMLSDDIARMPQGLDTDVGPSGARLSGGQRQRVAIARALLDRPSFLVLDEPTSSLDRESQAGIIDTLQHLRGGIGLIVVTHSRDLGPLFDRTVSLDFGS